MIARLTSRSSALRLFFACAVIILASYGAVLLSPMDIGKTGLYAFPAYFIILWVFIIASLAAVLSIVIYAVKSRAWSRTAGLVVAFMVLLLPLGNLFSARQLQRFHITGLSTPNHVYQLARDVSPSNCPDTFDATTYACYSRIYLYQCDSLGLLCSVEADDQTVNQKMPLRLQRTGDKIQVIGDDDTLVYELPA